MTAGEVRQPAPGRIITAPEYPGTMRRDLFAANILTARDSGLLPEWTIKLRPGDFAPGQKIHGTARRRSGKPRPLIIAADGSYATMPQDLAAALQSNPTDLSAVLTLSDSGQL